MKSERAAGLGHLHQRQHAFLHARTGGGGNDDDAALFGRGEFDRAGDFFPDHRSHRAGEKLEIHHRDHGGLALDAEASGDDGIIELGTGALLFDFFRVFREAQRVGGNEVRVELLEAAFIGQIGDAIARAVEEMMATGRTDIEILLQVQLVQHGLARRTFRPHAFGHVVAFFLRTETGSIENSHGGVCWIGAAVACCGPSLASHDGYDNYVFMLIPGQNLRAFLDRGAGGEDVIDEDDSLGFCWIQAFSRSGERNRPAQVLQALFAGEVGLGGGGFGAFQGRNHGQAEQRAEVAGDFLRLVVVAFLLAFPVQRHGHERPPLLQRLGEARIEKCLARDPCEIAGEVEAALVLEAVDEGAGVVAIPQHGPREAKRVGQIAAVRTEEFRADVALEHFPARRAKRLTNARQAFIACLA